jgi:hypothetical protein
LIELLNVLKFVVIIFISLSYFKSQNYMKIMRKNLIGIANLHISTIFLLNAGTVPTVWYIFFHFIIGYENKKQLSCNCCKIIWLWSSSVIKIVKMKYNRIDIKWRLASTSFRIYLDILSYFYITFTICYYNTINIFHSSVHFFPVLVKGLYQTESYSLHVMQLIRI